MTTYQFTNNASATLASSITDVATSLTVSSGQGSLFPVPAGGAVFMATLTNSALQEEIIKVTARAVDTFTIERAQEGTNARTWAAGDLVELRVTAAAMNELAQHHPKTTGAHAASAIGFTPAGGLSSSDVQAALVELDSEKQDKTGTFPYAQLTGVPPVQSRFVTGQYVFIDDTTAPTGTLPTNGGTIGNATSGGTTRANADCADLFAFIWRTRDNTLAPIQTSAGVPTTRGASAAADFAANKRLPLPDLQDGEALVAAVSSAVGARTAGENVAHGHTGTVNSSGSAHFHGIWGDVNTDSDNTGGGAFPTLAQQGREGTVYTDTDGAHSHTLTIDSSGGTKNKAAGLFTRVYIAM